MDENVLDKKLRAFNASQQSIETLSLWVLHHKHHSQQIASAWLRIMRKANVQHRLALFYLCNDVIQRCRKQNRLQFLDAFKEVLPAAGPLLVEQSIRKQVERVYNLWITRRVYDEAFVEEIRDQQAVVAGSPSPPQHHTPPPLSEPTVEEEAIDFEPTGLVEQVKKVRKLQSDVGAKMGLLSSTKLDISKAEVLASCKDKQHCVQFERDFDEGIHCLKSYVSAMEKSLAEHRELQNLLFEAQRYYSRQLSDVQLVANGFSQFAVRVEDVKEGVKRFRIPSPPPLPDECPSPTDSEMDDMVISPARSDRSTPPAEITVQPVPPPSQHLPGFNPSSASFMNSDPQMFNRLKHVMRRDSESSSQHSPGPSGLQTMRDSRNSSVGLPLPPPPLPTGLLPPPPPFLGASSFITAATSVPPRVTNVPSGDQDEIKEVDMEIENEDDDPRQRSPPTGRPSNIIELTSTKDVDLRMRRVMPSPLLPTPLPSSLDLSSARDVDERFLPRMPAPSIRPDRSFVPPAFENQVVSPYKNPHIPDLTPNETLSVVSNGGINLDELLRKIAPAINQSNLTTLVQPEEQPAAEVVDPDAYDPAENFVIHVPTVIYSPPKPESSKESKEKVPPESSQLVTPEKFQSPSSSNRTNVKGMNNGSSSSSSSVVRSSPNKKIFVDYAHRRSLMNNTPSRQGTPIVDHRRSSTTVPVRLPEQSQHDARNIRIPRSDLPSKSEVVSKRDQLYDRRSPSSRDNRYNKEQMQKSQQDNNNHRTQQQHRHRQPAQQPQQPQQTDNRLSRAEGRRSSESSSKSSHREQNVRSRGGENQRNNRSAGQRQNRQNDGRGWGASLEVEDKVFGYQHDKIDYLSLPRPVKKPPKTPKPPPAPSPTTTIKSHNASLKNKQSPLKRLLRVANASPAPKKPMKAPEPTIEVEVEPPVQEIDLIPETVSFVEPVYEQNIIPVEMSELEDDVPAEDPMLAQYFDTSSSFIVKDISEADQEPLPLITIESEHDLWPDGTILEIDDGYGATDGSKAIASLLVEEPSIKTLAGRKSSQSGLRGGLVATTIGARRTSCRDQGAFEDFY